MRVIVEPIPTNENLSMNPTLPTDPTPSAVNTMVTTQTPEAKSAATTTTSIPVTVYILAQGKFKGISYPTRKFQEGEGPSTPGAAAT